MPNIIKVYENAKKQTFLTEAKTVYREAEKKIASEVIKGKSIANITSEDNTKLSMTGKKLKYCIGIQEEKVTTIAVSDGSYYIEVFDISKIKELKIEDIQKGEYDDLPCYTGGQEIGEEYTFEEAEEHEFIAPTTGIYRLEVWGAQGGYQTDSSKGGKGGYSKGEVVLKKGDKIYIYVGGSGNSGGTSGGFNGGGARTTYNGGGGATDIRIGGNSLYHRLIVAGGGGSEGGGSSGVGGAGGGTSGQNGTGVEGAGGISATQVTAGTRGSFGSGGTGIHAYIGYGGAGGGGWYGGGGVTPDTNNSNQKGGGGGSGFIWTSSTASNVPSGYEVDTKYYLFNYEIKRGTETLPDPSSTTGGTMTGKSGNGYARISYVGKDTRKQEFIASIKSKAPYEIEEPGIYKLEIPVSGKYKLEVWGAQGGYQTTSTYGGKGGYSKGEINLTSGEELYIYLGASGNTGEVLGGFNGGGTRVGYSGGGGATDIRIGGDTLYHRLIVAGGGGSEGGGSITAYVSSGFGGAGGGTSGEKGTGVAGAGGTGGAQKEPGTQGAFGIGGKGAYAYIGYGGAGGGGWYGGGGITPDTNNEKQKGGGGGSGFIWTSSTASNVPSGYLVNAKYYLFNYEMKRGNESIPDPSSTTGGTMIGRTGNGYVRLTYLGKDTRREEFIASIEAKTPYKISEPGIHELEIPVSGKFKLEVWGAQGGYREDSIYAGKGGYSTGKVNLEEGDKLYIYIGASGTTGEVLGGFNGGGARTAYNGGGGATDMRIGGNTLNHRFIVAGGGGSDGGGSIITYTGVGGAGGGASGQAGTGYAGVGGTGGTQNEAGTRGTFGIGGTGVYAYIGYGGAGGGGWYGGGGVTPDTNNENQKGGGGGSGFIWTSTSNVSSEYKVSIKYYLLEAQTIAGNITNGMPDPSSATGGTMTGKTGNGYASITYLE